MNIVEWEPLNRSTNNSRQPDVLIAYREAALRFMMPRIINHPFSRVHLDNYFRSHGGTLETLVAKTIRDLGKDYRPPIPLGTERGLTSHGLPKVILLVLQLVLYCWFLPEFYEGVERFLGEPTYPGAAQSTIDVHSLQYMQNNILLPMMRAMLVVKRMIIMLAPWANWGGIKRGGMRRVEVYLYANFIRSCFYVWNNFGPDPPFDRGANNLLARAVG